MEPVGQRAESASRESGAAARVALLRAHYDEFRKVAREQGTAVVVVTHDHRTLDVFDTIYEMEDGVLSRSAKTA